jgi:hypothetical protein
MAIEKKEEEILNSNNWEKKPEKKVEKVEIPSGYEKLNKVGIELESQVGEKQSSVEVGQQETSTSGQGEKSDPSGVYARTNDPTYQAYKKIEQIMEDGLGDLYNTMNYREQMAFKAKGEETAKSIFQLVYHKSRVNVKKIIKLIRNWLKLIPGINKFFLEQEAKIKADKIITLIEQDKKIQF